MDQGERDQFFSCILPEMIELALSLPEICPMVRQLLLLLSPMMMPVLFSGAAASCASEF